MFIETSKNEETGKYEVEIKATNTVNLQKNKNIQVTDNGTITINPDEGYDGMKKITLITSVLGDSDYVKKVTLHMLGVSASSYPFSFEIEFKSGHRGETFTLLVGPYQYNEKSSEEYWHNGDTSNYVFTVPNDSDTVTFNNDQLYFGNKRKTVKDMYMRIYEGNFWRSGGSIHPPFPRSQEFGIDENGFDVTEASDKVWNFN